MISENQKDAYSLVSDVGATNARIQLITFNKTSSRPTVVKSTFYLVKDYPTFADILRDFLKEFQGTEKYPQTAVLALAGAPYQNKLRMVNCHWTGVDGNALSQEFKISPFTLLNDFEAVGWSFFRLPQDNLITLHDTPKIEGKSIVIAGTGSGLGYCVLCPTKNKEGKEVYQICPSEGGNRDFPATEVEDWEYLQFCLKEDPEIKEIGRLSTETSFGGLGIPNIYNFFCAKEGVQPQKLSPKEIFEKALEKSDPICRKVLNYNIKLLARELSNFALDSLPYGGIYLMGHLASLTDYLLNDPECPFKKYFFSKDKTTNENVLAKFPIYIITAEKELGLLGAFVKAQTDVFGHGCGKE